MESEEKIILIRQLQESPGWKLMEDELNRQLVCKQVEIEVLLEKGRTLEATHKSGEILGIKIALNLPRKIYYQNLTIVERIKLMLGGKVNATHE